MLLAARLAPRRALALLSVGRGRLAPVGKVLSRAGILLDGSCCGQILQCTIRIGLICLLVDCAAHAMIDATMRRRRGTDRGSNGQTTFLAFTEDETIKHRAAVHLPEWLHGCGRSVQTFSVNQGRGTEDTAAGVPSGTRTRKDTAAWYRGADDLPAGLVSGGNSTVLRSRWSQVNRSAGETIIHDTHHVIGMHGGEDVSTLGRRRICPRSVGWGLQRRAFALGHLPLSAGVARENRHCVGASALAVASAVGTTAYTL